MKKTIVTTLILALLASSCTVGSQGLFYSIEKEQKTEDADKALPNTVSVYDMAEFNGNYYLTTYSLYTKPKSNGSWQQKDISAFTGGRNRALSVFTLGSELYIAASGDNYSNTALYRTTTPLTGGYAQVTITAGEELFPGCIIPIQNTTNAYVITRTVTGTQYTYKVYVLGSTLNVVNTGIVLAHPPLQAAFNGSSTYLMTTKAVLLTSSNLNGAYAEVLKSSIGVSDQIGGLTYVPGATGNIIARFFISTVKGSIFSSPDGSTWTAGINNGFKVYSTDSNPASIGLLGVYNPNSTSPLIFGLTGIASGNTSGTGYVEIVSSSGWKIQAPTVSVDANNYSSTVLSTASLTNFFIDGANDGTSTLFIGTAGNGLWKRNTSDNKWAWE